MRSRISIKLFEYDFEKYMSLDSEQKEEIQNAIRSLIEETLEEMLPNYQSQIWTEYPVSDEDRSFGILRILGKKLDAR